MADSLNFHAVPSGYRLMLLPLSVGGRNLSVGPNTGWIIHIKRTSYLGAKALF